jgi:hypothetical protein
MYVRRQRVRELMEGERALVGDDSGPIGPEPGGHQLFVLAGWEVGALAWNTWSKSPTSIPNSRVDVHTMAELVSW